jgi:pantothenate kinase
VAGLIEAEAPGACVVVPMDGFHYDDAVLEARGWRARKGAPHTFDTGGLAALLRRLKAADEDAVAYPVFDRGLELSRAAAAVAPRSARVVLVEGNYLLLGAAPWSQLAPLFDLRVMTECPAATVAARLRARWEGFGLPEAEITRRLEANDLPNARLVMVQSIAPDLRLDTGA